jgi:demethylmenaquinone methyltransferase/2-methoxy-6-polyprenyl-1,4-benzoquinol methylase
MPKRERENRPDGLTHFGYAQVPSGEKSALVRDLFEGVAERYDLMNDLMSGGAHRLWKRAMVAWLAPRSGQHILDVAGGTGDIGLRILERAPDARVTIVDINQKMLDVGRDRAVDRGVLDRLYWVCADAEALPAPDASFDAYTIAFGIRNVTDIPRALREARRVLRPGGRFLCLEFSKANLGLLEPLYERYSFSIVPKIGEWITGRPDAYRYLVESIRRFPDQAQFSRMLADAGLGQVKHRNLAGGIAALHSAWRT